MTTLSIFDPVAEELLKVDANLRVVARVEFPLLAQLLSHILDTGGKRLRPALTLLAGNLFTYREDLLLLMATGVELLHTATLVHDDLVDNARTRRGTATVNSHWNSATAVLLGDYIFAQSAEFVARTGNLRVIHLFAQTLMTICDGELRQLSAARTWELTREHYYQRIYAKTAALFATAATSGAILSDAPEAVVQAMAEYGRSLGMAFQIVDDILDFVGETAQLGKPVGNDLLQGTVTLPALLLMERHPNDNPVRSMFESDGRELHVARAVEQIRNSDLIDQAYGIAARFCAEARSALDILPDGRARRSLREISEYVIERRR
ncbi:MAG: polyprenyl synthetase family protein [Chloroflexi bacterium]|nr:polyprenyl synthetase family protein [Chloroflexota bacterium]